MGSFNLPERQYYLDDLKALKKELLGTCSICDGSGWIRKTENNQVIEVDCDCRVKLLKFGKYLKANISRRFWKIDLIKYRKMGGSSKAAEITEIYSNNLTKFLKQGVGILYFGPYGTGKTTLAIKIGIEAINAGYSVYFYPVTELVDDIVKRQLRFSEIDIAEAIVENVDFLILDDFGKEDRVKQGLDSQVKVKLDKILRVRNRRMLPTIGSTNLDIKKTENLYGKSVFSIFQDSMKFILVDGNDLRQGKAEKDFKEILNDTIDP